MKTQKEILKQYEGMDCYFRVKEAFDLERQEAIKECKSLMKKDSWYYTNSFFIVNYLIEFYSINDEELR